MIDQLTRFVILIPVPNPPDLTVAKALSERVFGIFCPGRSSSERVAFQFHDVFGYKKTLTTPDRPQGNSVPERMHSTLHHMLVMYSNVATERNCCHSFNWLIIHRTVGLCKKCTSSSCLGDRHGYLSILSLVFLIRVLLYISHLVRGTMSEHVARHTTAGKRMLCCSFQ